MAKNEGLKTKLQKHSQLPVDADSVSAVYVSFSARKECKSYALGSVKGSVVVADMRIPFTMQLYQGSPEADEKLATAWLGDLERLNLPML